MEILPIGMLPILTTTKKVFPTGMFPILTTMMQMEILPIGMLPILTTTKKVFPTGIVPILTSMMQGVQQENIHDMILIACKNKLGSMIHAHDAE